MLEIHERIPYKGIMVLELSGRITLGADCQRLEAEVDTLISAGQANIIADLTNVKYVDSTGVGTLVMCSRKLKDAGGQLRLAGTGGAAEVIKLTQTNAIVPTHDSVAEAMAAFVGNP